MITNIDMTDRGVYKCIATNLIGSGSEWTLKLSVRCESNYSKGLFNFIGILI